MNVSRRTSRGFTLIELLVVVAIITTLVSILLPSLGHARNQAKNVACMSNLKQMNSLIWIYMSENNQSLPPGKAAGGIWSWPTYLNDLTAVRQGSTLTWSKIFRCPSATFPMGSVHYSAQPYLFANIPYTTKPVIGRMNELSEKPDTVLLMDATQNTSVPTASMDIPRNAGQGSSAPLAINVSGIMDFYNPGASDNNASTGVGNTYDADSRYQIRWRHGSQPGAGGDGKGEANFLFADGSVRNAAFGKITKAQVRALQNGREK